MMTRLTALLAASVAVLVLAAPAGAHYKDNNGWWFGGSTLRSASGGKSDPLNVIIYPWGGPQTRIEDHLNAHWHGNWDKHDEISHGRLEIKGRGVDIGELCRGNQYVNMRADAQGHKDPRPTNFHGVAYKSVRGPLDDCRNRYHTRMWTDDRHEASHGTHSPGTNWAISGWHYEEISVRVKLDCKFRPRPCRLKVSIRGHHPTKDWDAVEAVAIQQMRYVGASGHTDPRGRPGRHCAHLAWKVRPGSDGPYQKFNSDGRVSQIGMTHC